jgi:hypothetical protein
MKNVPGNGIQQKLWLLLPLCYPAALSLLREHAVPYITAASG